MIDLSNFQREEEISGDSKKDTRLLKQMALDARKYIGGFAWSNPIRDVYLACGVGGILALFLVEFELAIQGSDKFLWVIVGDLPSAYLVTDLETPGEVLNAYVSLMENWAHAVKQNKPIDAEFPVHAPTNLSSADMMLSRTKLLKSDVIPFLLDQVGHSK